MSSKIEIYKQQFTEEDTPGLDAINNKEKEIYGNLEPMHWATIVPYELGGEDPLWAIDCYNSKKQKKHFHCISLGFTNLFYDEGYVDDEINGFGFELTFRHLPVSGDPEKPIWAVNLIQNIAKYVFKTQNIFDDYHYMNANGPIRLNTKTDITAFTFVTDPELGEIDSPHGSIKFLQLFGITTQEYQDLKEKRYTAKELIEKHKIDNPLLITDLNRTDKKKSKFWPW